MSGQPQAAPLLDNQNFYVRLHIAILLGQLDLTDENSKLGFRQEAFVPAAVPLVKFLANPAQPESIKVPVVNGIVRILRLGSPNVVERTNIASAIISHLRAPDQRDS